MKERIYITRREISVICDYTEAFYTGDYNWVQLFSKNLESPIKGIKNALVLETNTEKAQFKSDISKIYSEAVEGFFTHYMDGNIADIEVPNLVDQLLELFATASAYSNLGTDEDNCLKLLQHQPIYRFYYGWVHYSALKELSYPDYYKVSEIKERVVRLMDLAELRKRNKILDLFYQEPDNLAIMGELFMVK